MRLLTVQNIIRLYILVISILLVVNATELGGLEKPLLAIGSGGLLGLPWVLLGSIVVSSREKRLAALYALTILIYLSLSIL